MKQTTMQSMVSLLKDVGFNVNEDITVQQFTDAWGLYMRYGAVWNAREHTDDIITVMGGAATRGESFGFAERMSNIAMAERLTYQLFTIGFNEVGSYTLSDEVGVWFKFN